VAAKLFLVTLGFSSFFHVKIVQTILGKNCVSEVYFFYIFNKKQAEICCTHCKSIENSNNKKFGPSTSTHRSILTVDTGLQKITLSELWRVPLTRATNADFAHHYELYIIQIQIQIQKNFIQKLQYIVGYKCSLQYYIMFHNIVYIHILKINFPLG
jgi:hypothetical protein